MTSQTELKQRAAGRALEDIKPGMKIGLGTGSTAEFFIKGLGAKVAQGFACVCVPTSVKSAELAQSLNIPLADISQLHQLDITVDGADEIDGALTLIKGGGGAHLREKIIASASCKLIIIADQSKYVDQVGAFGLPIEVCQFGFGASVAAIKALFEGLGYQGEIRQRLCENERSFISDEGHFIVDAFFGLISDAQIIADGLVAIPGVVDHGLFINIASAAYIAAPDGIAELGGLR